MNEATYLTAIKAASARGWRRVEPVPLGDPEEPRRLLTFIRSPASTHARTALPTQMIEDIVQASVAT